VDPSDNDETFSGISNAAGLLLRPRSFTIFADRARQAIPYAPPDDIGATPIAKLAISHLPPYGRF
jgi:hypothetical protein